MVLIEVLQSKLGLQDNDDQGSMNGSLPPHRSFQEVVKNSGKSNGRNTKISAEETERLQCVVIPRGEIQASRESWRYSLVGRFLGCRMDF